MMLLVISKLLLEVSIRCLRDERQCERGRARIMPLEFRLPQCAQLSWLICCVTSVLYCAPTLQICNIWLVLKLQNKIGDA